MIILQLMCGLGNQMFQYALGRRLAVELGVPLMLDLSWFSTQKKRKFVLDKYNIKAEFVSPEDLEKFPPFSSNRLLRGIFNRFEKRLPYYARFFVLEQNSGHFDPRVLKVSGNRYLKGYWQSEKYFTPIAPLLRNEFTLKEPFSPEYRAWEGKINKDQSISLHVRRDDYVNNLNLNQKHGICQPAYYNEAINYIRSQAPVKTLFVFSDDMDWARQNLGNYAPIEFVELRGKNRDQEEMLLMSLCDHHIIANSSYSWWGAWLGTFPHKIVIAPQKWFNDATLNTKDLIPETWIRI